MIGHAAAASSMLQRGRPFPIHEQHTAGSIEARLPGARRNLQLQLIDVPNGRHGFDVLDHTDESRATVTAALDAVRALLA